MTRILGDVERQGVIGATWGDMRAAIGMLDGLGRVGLAAVRSGTPPAVLALLLMVAVVVGCGADEVAPTSSIDRAGLNVDGATTAATASLTVSADEDGGAVPASPISGGGIDLTSVARTEVDRHVFIAPVSVFVVADPVFGDYGDSDRVMFEIYAGLTEFTHTESGPGVRLDMASSHDVSEDGAVHTFVLRQGLRFSDGSPVTALDFKWSWERGLRVAAAATVATQAERVLSPILGADVVLAGDAQELQGVEAVDERTLVVTLRNPSTDLRFLLAHPAAAVLKRENVEGWTTDWSERVAGEARYLDSGSGGESGGLPVESLPVGTGPFRLVSFSDRFESERFVVERNEFYHGAPAALDAVHFDGTAFDRAFEHGDGTAPNFLPLMQAQEFDVGFGADDEWPTTASGWGRPRMTLLVLNPSVAPLDDLDFRRALAHAIDPQAFIEALGDGREVPTGIAPPGTPGHSDESKTIRFDLEAAQAAFDAYVANGGISPASLTWTSYWESTSVDLRAVATEAWATALPVRVNVNIVDVGSYEEARRENRLTLAMDALRPAYAHPSAAVVDLVEYLGESASSPELERVADLMDAAAFEADPVVQLARYGELERFLLEQALVIPLMGHPEYEFAVDVQPWVHGYREHAYGGSRFRDVWFDETYPGGR